jgi:hypothetical protein
MDDMARIMDVKHYWKCINWCITLLANDESNLNSNRPKSRINMNNMSQNSTLAQGFRLPKVKKISNPVERNRVI